MKFDEVLRNRDKLKKYDHTRLTLKITKSSPRHFTIQKVFIDFNDLVR